MRSLKPGSAWIGCGPKSRSAILDLGPVHCDRPDDEYVDGDDDRGPDGVRREERHVDERTGERDENGVGAAGRNAMWVSALANATMTARVRAQILPASRPAPVAMARRPPRMWTRP